jgi:hypothetical protein
VVRPMVWCPLNSLCLSDNVFYWIGTYLVIFLNNLNNVYI